MPKEKRLTINIRNAVKGFHLNIPAFLQFYLHTKNTAVQFKTVLAANIQSLGSYLLCGGIEHTERKPLILFNILTDIDEP